MNVIVFLASYQASDYSVARPYVSGMSLPLADRYWPPLWQHGGRYGVWKAG
jgi:hypothetical protein